nr:hypothetical protein [Tanacetum cinerariifolium]
ADYRFVDSIEAEIRRQRAEEGYIVKLRAFCKNVVEDPMYQFYEFKIVVLYISCAVDPQSKMLPDSYSAASYFGGVTYWYQSQDTNISHFGFSNTIMSDSEDSTVTYTTVSSPYEGRPGDISPGVDGPPEPEQAPPSPVYKPYVPESVYPEYIPPEDDVFPAKEQPLPGAATPTTDSPGYIPESDPDEDPENDDDKDPEEDPADYPADHDDDEEEEPSRDDADEEDEEQ